MKSSTVRQALNTLPRGRPRFQRADQLVVRIESQAAPGTPASTLDMGAPSEKGPTRHFSIKPAKPDKDIATQHIVKNDVYPSRPPYVTIIAADVSFGMSKNNYLSKPIIA